MANGLCVELKHGEAIDLDEGRIVITIEKEKGSRVRLRVEAPRGVPVRRIARQNDEDKA